MKVNDADFIQAVVDLTEKEGYAPSMIELSEHFGWQSPNAAHERVKRLVKNGQLTHTPGMARTLRAPRGS